MTSPNRAPISSIRVFTSMLMPRVGGTSRISMGTFMGSIPFWIWRRRDSACSASSRRSRSRDACSSRLRVSCTGVSSTRAISSSGRSIWRSCPMCEASCAWSGV